MIAEKHAPSRTDIAVLRDRQGELRQILAPGDRHHVALEVRDMFAGFPSTAGWPSETKRSTLRAFDKTLAGLPLWAVREGIEAIRATGPAFPPSDVQVRNHARLAMRNVESELAEIETVLRAEKYHEATLEERSRVDAIVNRFRAAVAVNKPSGARKWPAEPERRHALPDGTRVAFDPATPVTVSSGLRAILEKR